MSEPAQVEVRATTRVAGIIGDPIRHSLSPLLHNTAYRSLGLDWVYAAFLVPAGGAGAALAAARALSFVGLSVTMPHKADAAGACDDLDPRAALLRSVNTVTVGGDGRLHGSSTDGDGFLRALADAGHAVDGAAVLVLGAGGAARAVACALHGAGARVVVAARRPAAGEEVAALAGGATVAWDDRDAAVRDAEIVVHATPLGMGADPADPRLPIDPAALHPGHVVADLVYHPLETPLLAAAARAGARTVDGLGMLVHQAALQIEHWSGMAAPVEAMRAAARRALAG
jgi:shikimate dehydrogenase